MYQKSVDVDTRNKHLHYKDQPYIDEESNPHEDEEYSSGSPKSGQNYSNQCNGLLNGTRRS